MVSPAATAAAPPPAPTLSPALRRLQRELEAARAEARSLQELLEELPAILERKFQLRLHAVLAEQRLLEADNAHLQQHLLALHSGAISLLLQPSPPPALPPEAPAAEPDSPITQGLGLRRALRLGRR